MIRSIIFSILAGVIGTGIGGAIGTLFTHKKSHLVTISYLVGGFMLSIVAFDLIPKSLESASVTASLISYVVGIVIIIMGSRLVEANKKNSKGGNYFELKEKNVSSKNQLKSGIIILFAVALHNLPEGLAIGASETGGFGVYMAILIALHDIPEGMAITSNLVGGGMRKGTAILLSLLSGIPTAIGGALGSLISMLSTSLIGICLAIAGGSMAYVTFSEIIRSEESASPTLLAYFLACMGFIIGVFL